MLQTDTKGPPNTDIVSQIIPITPKLAKSVKCEFSRVITAISRGYHGIPVFWGNT